MTIYRRGRIWWYNFTYAKQRHQGSTEQLRKEDAHLVESALKLRLRQEAGGIAPRDPSRCPFFADWAGIYYQDAQRWVTRPRRIDDLLRVVLRFWGAQPAGTVPADVYHNLRLSDPIRDPAWLERFELWIRARAPAAQTRNQYRSVMSQMYVLAMKPEWTQRTGITSNPFASVRRERGRRRTVALSAVQVRQLLAVASYHVRLAIAIGALAPKLRLQNILRLQWREHLDDELSFITVRHHKTAEQTQRPLVMPISTQLRTILLDARRRTPGDYVVTYRGRPIRSIRGGVKAAALRAGLAYGRDSEDGLSFHSLRHSAGTLLTRLKVTPTIQRDVMGHTDIQTSMRYSHLLPYDQVEPTEQLSGALPIADLVMVPWRRVRAVAETVASDPAAPSQTLSDSTADATAGDEE